MNKRSMVFWTAAFTCLLATALLAMTACGDDGDSGDSSASVGDLEISGAFARSVMDGGAAYFTVKNSGDEADALTGASTDAAAMAGLHTVVMEGATSRMEPVDQIEIPAKGEATLKPGGYHVMLTDLTEPLEEGDEIEITLTFERAGSVTLPVTVVSFDESDGEMDEGMDGDTGTSENP